jgi:hypothetical protein
MSQTEPKRTETHYTSAEKLVQAQSISCVLVWNALDVPVFGTSRPQNPPCLTIVLHWFWGYTCSNTRMFTEHTTTFPASSTHTYAHAHTRSPVYGNWDAERISVAFRYAAAIRQCEKISQEHVPNSLLKSSLPGSPYLLNTCLWMRLRVPARTLYAYTSIDMKKCLRAKGLLNKYKRHETCTTGTELQRVFCIIRDKCHA